MYSDSCDRCLCPSTLNMRQHSENLAFLLSRDADLKHKAQFILDEHGQPVWRLRVVKCNQIIRVVINLGAVAFQ